MTWKNEYNHNRQTYLTQKQRERRQKLKTNPTNSATDSSKYYGAQNIKILMSFKEYTELSKDKKKLWLDFNWTLQDCQSAIQEGLGDITAIMKLEQVANILIRDYWTTAKSELRQKTKSWNSLSDNQQQRLIKFWGREKARIEKNFLDTNEKLERQSQEYLKEIELQKFHEEQGKIKCACYECSERANIQQEIKSKVFGYQTKNSKEQCPDCQKFFKELDEEHGLCAKCVIMTAIIWFLTSFDTLALGLTN
ncbi:MAG: hypothetical protein mread185_000701 [Mycoplasmataceae bacterium]|nr:MAG: hypothetical protein mread185_000701 [Mycoplasmataceae bacterium]